MISDLFNLKQLCETLRFHHSCFNLQYSIPISKLLTVRIFLFSCFCRCCFRCFSSFCCFFLCRRCLSHICIFCCRCFCNFLCFRCWSCLFCHFRCRCFRNRSRSRRMKVCLSVILSVLRTFLTAFTSASSSHLAVVSVNRYFLWNSEEILAWKLWHLHH